MSGSSAMLAESAHSIADTMNEGFLLTALKRGNKSADVEHPFGYGLERYFWSLLAAVGIFVLGAGFSVFEGIYALMHPEPLEGLLIPMAVLGLSALIEGTSWAKAIFQLRGESREKEVGVLQHVLQTPDPTVKTVAFEDTAALVGLALAAAGLGLHALTGSPVWDAVASFAIGALLVVVAVALGVQNKKLLIGSAVARDVREGIERTIEETPGVDRVVELLTMRLGPESVLVAARVDVDDDTSGGDLEQVADEVDRRVVERYGNVRHVFLDPTASGAPSGATSQT
jgi:cation diffusion facilitator family transporter